MSIKQAFLSHKNELKKLHVEDLGVDVYISKWSGIDRARILPVVGTFSKLEELEEDKKYKEMFSGMAKVIQETLKNEDGTRVFDSSEEDFNLVLNFNGEELERLFGEIMEQNGVGEKEIVEAAKN